MRRTTVRVLLALAGVASATPAAWAKGEKAATDVPWLKTLDDGTKAAARDVRPVCLVTIWPQGT